MKALDDVFGLLERERRRYALYVLEESDGPIAVEELAARIAEWESDGPGGVPDDVFEDVTLTLQHHHLPKAAEAEFIEYDSEENVVRLTGSPAEFGVVLSVARAIEQPGNDAILNLRDLV